MVIIVAEEVEKRIRKVEQRHRDAIESDGSQEYNVCVSEAESESHLSHEPVPRQMDNHPRERCRFVFPISQHVAIPLSARTDPSDV